MKGDSCMMIATLLVIGLTFLTTCATGEDQTCTLLNPPARYKHIVYSTSAAIKIYSLAHDVPKIKDIDHKLIRIDFDPPLVNGVDYVVSPIYPFKLPDTYFYHPNATAATSKRTMLVQVELLSGRKWVKDISDDKDYSLYIKGIYYCKSITAVSSALLSLQSYQHPVQIASVIEKVVTCPTITLPNIGHEFATLLKKVLSDCHHPTIVKSRNLNHRSYYSNKLLHLTPSLFFIDGTDQSLTDAAYSVDRFLAPHSVMDIVWEPFSDSDPRWWILMPHPQGMPGHLFAALDAIQWKHPYVKNYRPFNTICNETIQGCTPGCPKTNIYTITGSGWGADGSMIASRVIKGSFKGNTPMQISPIKLGRRQFPPYWANSVGWTYTYGGCKSNFLDCFFLDHSPCPQLQVDVRNAPGLISFNKTRLDWPILESGSNPPHWVDIVGGFQSQHPNIPTRTIGNVFDTSSRHVGYSYIFRPKYDLRRTLHERLRDEYSDIGLAQDAVTGIVTGSPCAAMHVRRGDILGHPGQARSYVTIDAYVRAAKIYMTAMNIKSIVLLTDSHAAIEEALKCKVEYPDICKDIQFRYIKKKRWIGGEGGWENPFPSGNATEELVTIQLEFALASRCDLHIMGQSSYGETIYNHMCCKFPVKERGKLPQRCYCPPTLNIEQHGFTCEAGNKLVCNDMNNQTLRDELSKGFTSESFSKKVGAIKVWNRGLHDTMITNNISELETDPKAIANVKSNIADTIKNYCNKSNDANYNKIYCDWYEENVRKKNKAA